jgi:DnaJ-class molecular chaperone
MRRLSTLYSLLWLFFGYLSLVFANAGFNPYRVLGVSENASQDEIKRQYRALCLKYHPDKNTKRSTSERKAVETKFKQLQEAYSLIGTAEGRRNRKLRHATPFASSFSSTAPGQNQYFKNYQDDDFFAQAFRSYASRSGYGPSHRFHTTRAFGREFGREFWSPSGLKSVYEQRVPISLYNLYNGVSKAKFRLRENAFTRCCAAFRGGIGYAILYQSLLFVIPLWRMTNRWIALPTALGIFYQQLPRPFEDKSFEAKVQAGYKAGTRLTFQPTDPRIQVVFILEEEKHPVYRRMGDDLHAEYTLSYTEAKNGCTVSIETLGATESSIEIVLEPDAIQRTGQTLVIKGQGWPRRKTADFGDLVVHFTLVKSKRKKWV